MCELSNVVYRLWFREKRVTILALSLFYLFFIFFGLTAPRKRQIPTLLSFFDEEIYAARAFWCLNLLGFVGNESWIHQLSTTEFSWIHSLFAFLMMSFHMFNVWLRQLWTAALWKLTDGVSFSVVPMDTLLHCLWEMFRPCWGTWVKRVRLATLTTP